MQDYLPLTCKRVHKKLKKEIQKIYGFIFGYVV